MKVSVKSCWSLLCAGLLCATTAVAEEPAAEGPFSIDMGVDLYSDYMFRGQNLYDGTSIQPSMRAAYDLGGVTIGALLWSHISAEGDRQDSKFFELDETIYVEVPLDPVTLTVGNNWYTYPDNSDEINDTAEVFVTLALDDSSFNEFFALNPVVGFYSDYRDIEYQYFTLGFSHSLDCAWMGDGFNMTPSVTFGFVSDGETVYKDDGLVHVTWSIGMEMPLGDKLTVTPSFAYNHKVDDHTVNEFFFGTNFAFDL